MTNRQTSLRRWFSPKALSSGALVLLLAAAVVLSALPGYLGAPWPWLRDRTVPALTALRRLPVTGLTLGEPWQTQPPQERQIGSGKWVVMTLARSRPGGDSTGAPVAANPPGGSPLTGPEAEAAKFETVTLSLLPMKVVNDQPQVEWSDWEGVSRLQTDSQMGMSVPVAGGGAIAVRALRGWDDRQTTYAMVQWYAWPGGGSPAPGQWFWADRRAQLRGQRLPWVAVVALVQTKRPLDPLEDYLPLLKDAAAAVQGALEQGVFKGAAASETSAVPAGLGRRGVV